MTTPSTSVRPTARAVVVAVCAVVLWVLADLTRVMPARVLAAALLLILLIGGVCIALTLVGLHVRRRVVDEDVPAGTRARVQVDLSAEALITRVPLGRGVLREHLPAELGGRGDLALAYRMPHALTVSRRGIHQLGVMDIVVRDVFGMFHLRRSIEDGARVIGLPVSEAIDPAAARATGIAQTDQQAAATAPGIGEIGPIARPYVPGDDIRRIHWRASARTGALMTREDEPPAGRSALIVLDNRRTIPPSAALLAAEDRLVDHAASVLAGLRTHGWEVRVVDADGDEITRAERHRAGTSLLGTEADAMGERASLMALAEVGFDDAEPTFRPAQGGEHATGHPQVVVALGIDDGTPFDDLELDRFAGRARHRTSIALRPGAGPEADRAGRDGAGRDDDALRAGASEPTATNAGGWIMVRGHVGHTINELLTAAGPGEVS